MSLLQDINVARAHVSLMAKMPPNLKNMDFDFTVDAEEVKRVAKELNVPIETVGGSGRLFFKSTQLIGHVHFNVFVMAKTGFVLTKDQLTHA